MGSGGSKTKKSVPENASPLQNQTETPLSPQTTQNAQTSLTPAVQQQSGSQPSVARPEVSQPVQSGKPEVKQEAAYQQVKQDKQEVYHQQIDHSATASHDEEQQIKPPEVKPERKLNEKYVKERPPNEVLETPDILFFFDFKEKVFHYYNIISGEWHENDLNLSVDDCPDCPLFKYKIEGEEEEAVKFAKYLTYIALTDEIIYIIGGFNTFFSCLEYNITKNAFSVKKPMKVLRNNPSLCKYSKYIYAISGDNIDTFSKDASMYDTERNEWTTLTHLPSPQGFATVRIIYESKAALDLHETSFEPKFLNKNYEKNLKIAALGGLSQKFPRTYTPLFSLYSFLSGEWKVFDLSKIFTQRLPKFINCSMVQRREGDLIIVGCEGARHVFKLDYENMHLSKAGHLPNEDAFSVSMRSRESLYRDGQMYCLSHKFNRRIYQGYLAEEQWELIIPIRDENLRSEKRSI